MTKRLNSFWKHKSKLVAAALVVILLISASTYAWFTSRGILSGGDIALEKIKIAAEGLSYYDFNPSTDKFEWIPLKYDPEHPHIINLQDIYWAGIARDILSDSNNFNKNGEYKGKKVYVDGDQPPEAFTTELLNQLAAKNQFLYTIENVGDEAYVYTSVDDMLGVEPATNAFQIPPGIQKDLVDYIPGYYVLNGMVPKVSTLVGYPDGVSGYPDSPQAARTHIWFADVAKAVNDRQYPNAPKDYITLDDLKAAAAEVKPLLNKAVKAYEELIGDGYEELAEDFETKLAAAKASPGSLPLAKEAENARQALIAAEAARNSEAAVQIKLDKLLKEYNDYMILQNAMEKVKKATKSVAAIRESWISILVEPDSNPPVFRPLSITEMDTLLSETGSYGGGEVIEIDSNGGNHYTDTRNLGVTMEIQYGDQFTELSANLQVWKRVDDGSLVLKMGHGAKANILFTVNMPVKNITPVDAAPILGNPDSAEGNVATGAEKIEYNITHEDNVFNNALIWLGIKGNPVVGTNPSRVALEDITGVKTNANGEFTEKVGNKNILYAEVNVNDIMPAMKDAN
ncbi:MAG: hypothetical protein LBS84_07370 [Clostridiales bacterium]|jgi:hypothetical protein|nr:hypothetical protein [Clostridiales bacterium]